MLSDRQAERLSENYAVLLEPNECPKCKSIQAAMFMRMADGRPTVIAVCLRCGDEHMLPRFRPGEQSTERLGEWARAVKAADDQRCHICGRPEEMYPLDAHHIIPKSHDPNGRYWYLPSNGIALCRQCHELVHGEWMKIYRRK